jgi:hypothetical protein
MGEQWIRECNDFLRQIRDSMKLENPDRLDLVKSMHRALYAVNHSILGWFQYVNNPDIMSRFDRDELRQMSETLNKFAESFLEHDIEVTEKGMGKGLSEPKEEEEDRQPFYV